MNFKGHSEPDVEHKIVRTEGQYINMERAIIGVSIIDMSYTDYTFTRSYKLIVLVYENNKICLILERSKTRS